MSKKILVILGHPSIKSLNAAIADVYVEEIQKNNSEVRYIKLRELKFNLNLKEGYNKKQKLELDLLKAQEDIKQAEHLVFVYPTWWGSMPALLKGFFDRIFLPGFAFKFEGKSFLPKQYLKGKSARIITTAGGPWWYYFIFGNPSIASIKRITLAFCGVSPIKTKGFYDIKRVSQERAEKILFKVRKMARRDLS